MKALERYDRSFARREGGNRTDNAQNNNQRQNNAKHRDSKNKQWYSQGGKYESVMFIEPTPHSEFKKRVQSVVKKYGMKIKVVERVGETIKGVLQRSNPFGRQPCEREDCPICSRGLTANCRNRGCVYQLKCIEHEQVYRGQAGRSAYERTCLLYTSDAADE